MIPRPPSVCHYRSLTALLLCNTFYLERHSKTNLFLGINRRELHYHKNLPESVTNDLQISFGQKGLKCCFLQINFLSVGKGCRY